MSLDTEKGTSMRMSAFFLALAATISIGRASSSEPLAATPAVLAAIDAAASTSINPSLPSASVTVARDGKIVLSKTYGSAPPNGAYVVGSVTKMMTAVSVMQLVAAHKLRLDETIGRWFPGYSSGKTITVRQLLAHRSGIPDYLPAALTSGRVYSPTTPKAIVAEAMAKPLDFTPGTKWNYSNTGYVFAAQIVEKVSGLPLAQYERQHIYLPAGMPHTANGTAPAGMTIVPGTFTRPSFYGPGERRNDLSWYYACGDVVSTAQDLVKFDLALMRGALLPSSLFAQMQRVQSRGTLSPNLDDGLGLFVMHLGTRTEVGHHGGEPGYSADNEMVPADRFAVAVIVNSDTNADVLLQPAIQAFYPQQFAAMESAARASTAAAAKAIDPQLTARFQRVLNDLLSAKVDASDLSDPMIAALGPAGLGQFDAQFAAYGKLQSFTYLADQQLGAYHRYIYRGTFEHAAKTLIFVLDSAGKIAGLSQV